MRNWATRLLILIALNAVPVVGVGWAGWATATALVLYWCETIILVALVAVRIYLHRKWTNKRGHYVEVVVETTLDGVTKTKTRVGHFGTNFCTVALVFSAGQALFLGLILWKTGLLQTVNVSQLKQGLTAITAFLLTGFVVDLAGLRQWPFAQIRRLSDAVLWRVFLVHIAIIIGVFATLWFKLPRSTLIAFVVLKLYTDITAQVPQYNPPDAPHWMVRLLGSGFADYWRVQRHDEEERAADEETVFSGKPMPLKQNPAGQYHRQSRANS